MTCICLPWCIYDPNKTLCNKLKAKIITGDNQPACVNGKLIVLNRKMEINITQYKKISITMSNNCF